MPRRPRRDTPGQFHHVMNRGVRKRPLFDLPSDQRRFLALLACAVRAGRIRVHAFCLMQTHFHLVVESLDGDLSSTMGWLQSRHGLHFNRTRNQFGPLVGGRFKSIPITSGVYLFILIQYLDLNPVEAGLTGDPLLYEFGSACRHATNEDRPPWLARSVVQNLIAGAEVLAGNQRSAYRQTFHPRQVHQGARDLVAARMNHANRARDDLDALLQADGAARRSWVVKRATEADGTSPGLPMLDSRSVQEVVETHRVRAGAAVLHGTKNYSTSLWDVAECALLRDLAGMGFAAIARTVGTAVATASKRYGFHLAALRSDQGYLAIVGEVTRQALERCYGPRVVSMATRLAEMVLSQRGAKSA